MRCDDGSDHPSFAVTNETDFLRVDLLAGFHVSESGFRIGGKIFSRGVGIIASGLADTTFIETKHGNAFSGEVIREDEKWAMADDAFIAIVRTRTAKKNGGGKWARAA